MGGVTLPRLASEKEVAMRKSVELQRIARLYKEETGTREVNPHDVVDWAVERLNYPLPAPQNPRDILANQLSDAFREETRRDKKSGRHYRANHAIPVMQAGKQLFFWIDIDEAARGPMHKSLNIRREQSVADLLQLSLDADHWNSIHPDEEPIVIQLDFTYDVEWRKNAPEERTA